MLSRFDDYPIHQTPEPIALPFTSDRNVYDRYWMNGYDRDGAFYFGLTLGRYAHRGVMDCALSVVREGEQHSFRASRRAPREPSETQVGPFRLEVLEPMRRLRAVLEPNETGIEAELEFRARTACVEEGRQTLRRDGRILMDATRFAQFGCWEGHIRYAGLELAIDPARVMGTKDRSWGLRPIGEPEAGGAPSQDAGSFAFVWAPLHWDDRCSHLAIFSDESGRAWHSDGMIVPAYASPEAIPGVEDPGTETMRAVEHRLRFVPGTRRAAAAELVLVARDGERHEISLEPLLRFQMKGLGYTHPQWGHGRWQGELAVTSESWKLEALDPLALDNQHIQQVMRARWGAREGVGVLEQLCFGPHADYGFEAFLDGAKA